MSETMHCCDCGREWVPGEYGNGRPHRNRCPRCDSVRAVPVAECLACQEQAVIPRQQWLCKPHEKREETTR